MARKIKIRYCEEPGCKVQIFGGKKRRCEPHRIVAEDRKIKQTSAAVTANRRALRAANPRLCVDNCGNAVSGMNKRCPACKAKNHALRHILYPKRELAEEANLLGPKKPPKPEPRKEVVPLMTTGEQLKIDQAQRKREEADNKTRMEAFGLIVVPGRPVASKARSFSAAEKAELAKKYAPPIKTPFFATDHICTWD